jgi:hypothetical protein
MAGYTRRNRDWQLQVDLANQEAGQLEQQILAADIRRQISESELKNHELQVAQAQEVEEFLRLKYTNEQLHGWMISKLSSVYFQAYQTAYRLAAQAQAAFRQELGPEEQSLTFIQASSWDSLRKGLLAGEQLTQQLRQMEAAHIAANRRELEIIKPVSLFQLDPAALLALRETGSCEVHIPEAAFDLDFAGHYYRRIKSVRLTIPCVVGPYVNVSATLSLTASWTRRSADAVSASAPERDSIVAAQTHVATSSANQDGGLFELSFNDPRYLPFEGAGAISTWRLELPAALRPFNYSTISDVVMHMSYTARDGGADLKAQVNDGLLQAMNDLKLLTGERASMSRLFSLRREFPNAWNRLVSAASEAESHCTLSLGKQHFPSFFAYEWQSGDDGTVKPQPITLSVKALTAYLSPKGAQPVDAGNLTLNEQTSTSAFFGIPSFDLTRAPGVLSRNEISNESATECAISIAGGLLQEADWNDLCLLMEYEAVAERM